MHTPPTHILPGADTELGRLTTQILSAYMRTPHAQVDDLSQLYRAIYMELSRCRAGARLDG